MNQELLIGQTKLESEALEHITRALEVMLLWEVNNDDWHRKLSSVRFFTALYQSHLERLFALEEIDGYMAYTARINPEMSGRIELLRQEHEELRAAVRKAVVRIDLASPGQLLEFDATCKDLRNTVNLVLEHLYRESELLMESFQRDTGGEG